MFRRAVVILALVLGATAVAASATRDADSAAKRESASRLLVGFMDDAQVYGNTTWSFQQLRALRAGIVRVTLDWETVAVRRPRRAADPADPAYNWTAVDRVLDEAAERNIRVMLAIYGTPRWAGPARNRLPRRILDLRLFATAAALRYSGNYTVEEDENEPERALPAVRYWLAWNEPNNPVFLRPQWKMVKRKWRVQSAYDYAKICSAIWAGVHATRLPGQRVACGATGPRGNDAPRSSRPSTSPLVFMNWLRRAGLRRMDAYAHHPYYGHRSETPATRSRSKKAVTMGNIGDLIRQLNRLYGRGMRLWITEYGYQTNPPDRLFGVSYANQARYLRQAIAIAKRTRRIDMLVWFLIRDEPRLSGWQSGVFTRRGVRKPAYRAFQTARR
ncbi:MAG: glycosyl hydrolase [Actinomycetota bacterium]|nr:glycosyl hydrolase [Actinomycetota bacterium]